MGGNGEAFLNDLQKAMTKRINKQTNGELVEGKSDSVVNYAESTVTPFANTSTVESISSPVRSGKKVPPPPPPKRVQTVNCTNSSS